MTAKWSRWRYLEARFVTILTIRFKGALVPAWPADRSPTRTGPVEADGAVDAQNAPTAPWKTLLVFHELPQGFPHPITHDKPRKSPESYWETRIDPYPDLYFEPGMRLLSTNRRGAYRETIEDLAQRIVRTVRDHPLPPMPERPQMSEVQNPFVARGSSGSGGPGVVAFALLPGFSQTDDGADSVEIEVASWRPFAAPKSHPIRSVIDGIEREGFRIELGPGGDELVQAFTAARAEKKRVRIFIFFRINYL